MKVDAHIMYDSLAEVPDLVQTAARQGLDDPRLAGEKRYNAVTRVEHDDQTMTEGSVFHG